MLIHYQVRGIEEGISEWVDLPVGVVEKGPYVVCLEGGVIRPEGHTVDGIPADAPVVRHSDPLHDDHDPIGEEEILHPGLQVSWGEDGLRVRIGRRRIDEENLVWLDAYLQQSVDAPVSFQCIAINHKISFAVTRK